MTVQVLEGYRVLSLAEQYPGPYAGLILSDLGADVVVVERPAGGDPTRTIPGFFESLSRGKRSLALDLKSPRGHDVFMRFVQESDVVMEGFKPGTAKRLGIDYDSVSDVNERIVYCSISGYGQDGPYRDRSGHDLSYQANAGLLYRQAGTGVPEPPPDLAIGDLTAGLNAVVGILAALTARERRGYGEYIDVSMFDCLVSLMASHLVPVMNQCGVPGYPYGPGYGVFKCADERLITLSVAHEDHFWERLCAALQMDDVAELDETQRQAHKAQLARRIDQRIAARTRSEWESVFTEHGIPFSPLLGLDEVTGDPHVLARELVATVPDARGQTQRYVRQPLRFTGSRAEGPTQPSPALGEHSVEVLSEAGFTGSEINDLVQDRVIATGYSE